jgi:subtilisin family serine protease
VDLGAPGTNVLSTWAGTDTVVDEPFSSGWNLSSGWGYLTLQDRQLNTFGALADPAGWGASPYATYAASADDRAWKAFDTSGADVATVDLFASLDLSSGDWIRFRCSASGDPFGPAGVVLAEDTGVHTGGFFGASFDLGACRGPASTLGVQLTASPPASRDDLGVALTLMSIRKLAWNTTSYNAISGTSMATPVVAGVAAMVRVYQPGFTPEDVIAALTGGGRAVPALAGRTRSGVAVQALGALTHVRPPRGLTFTVQ